MVVSGVSHFCFLSMFYEFHGDFCGWPRAPRRRRWPIAVWALPRRHGGGCSRGSLPIPKAAEAAKATGEAQRKADAQAALDKEMASEDPANKRLLLYIK